MQQVELTRHRTSRAQAMKFLRDRLKANFPNAPVRVRNKAVRDSYPRQLQRISK